MSSSINKLTPSRTTGTPATTGTGSGGHGDDTDIEKSVFSPADTNAVPLSLARPSSDRATLFGNDRPYFFQHGIGDETPPIKVPYRIIPSTGLSRMPLARAWEDHLAAFLTEADRAIAHLDDAFARGWQRLSDGERKALVASLARLDHITDAGTSFVVGQKMKPAAERTFSEVFVLGQLAKLRNAMVSPRILSSFLSGTEVDPAFFGYARDHLRTMYDPFDHLQKSYAIDPFVMTFLSIILPPTLPKIEAANPAALRKTIDDIVLRLGLEVEKARSTNGARRKMPPSRIAISVEHPGHSNETIRLVIRNMTPDSVIFSKVASAMASRQGILIRSDAIVIAVPLAADAMQAQPETSFSSVASLNEISVPVEETSVDELLATEEASVAVDRGFTQSTPSPNAVPPVGAGTSSIPGGH